MAVLDSFESFDTDDTELTCLVIDLSGVVAREFDLEGNTPSNSEIICGQNVSTKVVCGIFLFFEKKAMLKI